MAEFELYTKKHGLVKANIEVGDIKGLLKLDDNVLQQMVKDDVYNYKYGLSFNEFLYCCFSNLSSFEFSEREKEKLEYISKNYRDKVDYINMVSHILKVNECIKEVNFEINPDLIKALKQNMNSNYTLKEKAVYYYFKLCFLLDADLAFAFGNMVCQELNITHFLKSSDRLGFIDTKNNQACCFEFSAILNKLISNEGGLVFNNLFKGTAEHVRTTALLDRILITFDAYAYRSPNANYMDINSVKLDEGSWGIQVFDDEDLSWIDRVYDDVRAEFPDYKKRNKFSKDSFELCVEAISNLNLSDEEKCELKNYFDLFNSVGVDGVCYFSKFMNTFNKLDNVCNKFKLTGVGTIFTYPAIEFVFSVKQDNDEMIYFVFGKDSNICIYDKEEMCLKLESNEVVIFGNTERHLPIAGIDEEFQKAARLEALDTVCFDVISSVFKESICNEGKVYVREDNN